MNLGRWWRSWRRNRNGRQDWRDEFPYRRDADDVVTRRHFLQFSLLTSGALFGGTTVFAFLGRLAPRRSEGPYSIVRADEVPAGEAFYFRDPGTEERGVLLNLPEQGFVAYNQKCTHLACGVYYQPEHDRLFCPCHDGVFDPRTGDAIAGPPQRPLARIILEEREGVLYAVEEQP